MNPGPQSVDQADIMSRMVVLPTETGNYTPVPGTGPTTGIDRESPTDRTRDLDQ